jgi:hypothetical protein
MHVYLSGGMEYADDGGKGWREEMQQWMENEFGATVFNPPRESEQYLRLHHPGVDPRVLKATDPDAFRSMIRPIIERDCREIAEKADLVVCMWDHSAMRGAGTQGELTIARYFGKPVFLLSAGDPETLPAWIVGCTSAISLSPETLKGHITAFLKS